MMKVRTLAALLAAAIAAPAFASPSTHSTSAPAPHMATPQPHTAAPAPHPEAPALTVSGLGTVSVRPDRATVRLGAMAQRPEAGAAQAEVNRAMQAAIESIKKLGVPESAISTSGLTLFAVFEQRPRRDGEPTEPQIAGYRASNTISVQLDDLSKVGAVIDEGIKAGANQLEGLSFDLKDDAPQRREALQRAVRDARAKADAIASAMDMAIEGVQEVTEGGVSHFTPVLRGRQMGVAMDMADGGGTPVEPGQVRVEATVTIRYRLAPPNR